MKKKIILITGSSGFIGNLFLKSALKEGYFILDILRAKNKKNKILNNLRKKFPNTYNSIFFKEYRELKKKLLNKKFDYFINFATLYKNNHYHEEIPQFIESNITFPTILLDIIGPKIKKIINFGTMMQHVNSKNYVSKNFYASTKSAFEIIQDYFANQNNDIKFYNLKFYESFDEFDTRRKLIPTLLRNFKKNRKTHIISKKLELNLIHSQDIINAIYILLKNNFKCGTYCLINKKNVKINKLIININKKTKRKLKIKYLNTKITKLKKTNFKILPKWKCDKNIEKKILNKFYD